MAFVTYVFYDPKTSVPRYVGKGVDERRARSHLTKSSNPQLGTMLKKRITEGFKPEPKIFSFDTHDEAVQAEKTLIAKFGREDLGLGTLFNKTDGGEGLLGFKKSEETRSKHSLAMLSKSEEELQAIREKTRSTRNKKSDEAKAASFEKRSVARKLTHASKSAEERSMISINAGKATRKACTVDGIKIFKSRLALVEALGQGLNGSRSSNFRYI